MESIIDVRLETRVDVSVVELSVKDQEDLVWGTCTISRIETA